MHTLRLRPIWFLDFGITRIYVNFSPGTLITPRSNPLLVCNTKVQFSLPFV